MTSKIGLLTAIARRNAPTLTAIDLEEEEDRDRDSINEIMKQYTKLWRNIFGKYQTDGFAIKKESTFDKIAHKNKISLLSSGEVIKILRDHDCMP